MINTVCKTVSYDKKGVDEDTFIHHYNTYFSALYLHALKMLDDREEAKDVVQEVFTRIWTKRCEVYIQESFKSYLYKSVRNAVLDRISSKKTTQKYKDSILKLESNTTSIKDEAEIERELFTAVDSEISKLPAQMRLIFQLSRFEEKSTKEIASTLNISTNTVKTQISRALKVLKVRITYFF